MPKAINISQQTNTLQAILKTAKRQIKEVEKRFSEKDFLKLNIIDKKEYLRNNLIFNYLKNFWGTYEFLLTVIKNEKRHELLHNYLIHLRSLIEFYAELIFILHQNKRKVIGIFTGRYLLYIKESYKSLSQSQNLKEEYQRHSDLVAEVLKSLSINFPQDVEKMSNKFLEKEGFCFPDYERLLTKEPYASDFKVNSNLTYKGWKQNKPEDLYNSYYRMFSKYVHRSFLNPVDISFGTELFWIISFLYLLSQLMLELSNNKIFNQSYKADYNRHLRRFMKAKDALLRDW